MKKNDSLQKLFDKLEEYTNKKERDKVEMKKNEKTEAIGLENVKTSTRLIGKNYSPLIIRKHQKFGWPLYVGMICDISLSDLDDVINTFAKDYGDPVDDIQAFRNWCGSLSDYIYQHYNAQKEGCVEGIAVVAYWDKCLCSSLWGDFMTHTSCRIEFYSLLNMLPHV